MRDKILKLLEKRGDIPPLPEVMIRLEAKIEDPDVDIEEIALILLAGDPAAGHFFERLPPHDDQVILVREEPAHLRPLIGRPSLGVVIVVDPNRRAEPSEQ